MKNPLTGLIDPGTMKRFEETVRVVDQLVRDGMVEQAIAKLHETGNIVRSMSLSKSLLESLPVLTAKSIDNFFRIGNHTTANVGPLAISSLHHPDCRCGLCCFCMVVVDLCKILLTITVSVAVIAFLVSVEGAAVVLGYAIFVCIVLYIIWDGQRGPQVGLANPVFQNRLRQELVAIEQRVRRSSVTRVIVRKLKYSCELMLEL